MKHSTYIFRDLLAVCLCIAGIAVSSPAHATPERDSVAAEALFKSALALVEQGDMRGACAKFQASQDLDPAVSTMVKLAKCRELEGKLVEAWYLLEQALKVNRDKTDQTDKRRIELEKFTTAQLAGLEPRVPRLRITIKGAPLGLTVKRDGKEQPTATLGEALPVDPGAHEAIALATGHSPERRVVTLTEGQTADIVIEFVREPVVSVRGGDAPLLDANAPADAEPARASSGRRTAGFVVGGVGIVGLAAGGVLGIVTTVKAGGAADDVSGNAARDAARSTQTAALLVAGVGVAGLGVGLVLVATAPKTRSGQAPPRLAVGFGPNGLLWSGIW